MKDHTKQRVDYNRQSGYSQHPGMQQPFEAPSTPGPRTSSALQVIVLVLAVILLLGGSVVAVFAYQTLHAGSSLATQASTAIPTQSSLTANPTQGQTSPTTIPTQAFSPSMGALLLTYGGHTNGIGSVAWSPDGTRVVTGSWDQTAQVWNAKTGERLLIYRGHHSDLTSVSWSPDGTRIVSSAGMDEHILIWDAQTGQTLVTYSDSHPASQVQHYLSGATWSPDGKYVAFYRSADGNVDNEIYVMDASTGKLVHSLPVDTFVMALAWSPDSTRLAYGNDKAIVRIIAPTTGQLLLTYTGHKAEMYGGIMALSWSPNSKYIASGGLDTTVRVWDAATGKSLYTYTGHTTEIGAVSWSPDSRRIASSSGQQIQVWDAFTGGHVFIYSGHTEWVRALSWSPDGTRIVSVSGGNARGEVQVWQAA